MQSDIKCEIHHDKVIMVNLQGDSSQNSLYCLKCLQIRKFHKNLTEISEAKLIIESEVQKLYSLYKREWQQHIDNINKFSTIIERTKHQINIILSQMTDQLKTQKENIVNIGKNYKNTTFHDQFDFFLNIRQYEVLSTYPFTQQFDSITLTVYKSLEKLIEQLPQIHLHEFFTDSLINYSQNAQQISIEDPKLQPVNQSDIENKVNMYLSDFSEKCMIHQQKITKIDIGENIPIRQRVLCDKCNSKSELTIREFLIDYIKKCNKTLNQSKIELTLKFKKYNQYNNELQQYSKQHFYKILDYKKNINQQFLNLSEKVYLYISAFEDQLSTYYLQNIAQYISNNKNYFHPNNIEIQIFKKDPIDMQLKQSVLNAGFDNNHLNQLHQNNNNKTYYYSLLFEQKQNQNIYSFAFHEQLSLIAGAEDKIIRLWKIVQQGLIELPSLEQHQQEIKCIIFCRQKHYLFSGGYDNNIIMWIQDKNQRWNGTSILKEHNSTINQLIINKSDEYVLSCSNDSKINIWEINQNQTIILYESLQQCKKGIISISLNELETILVCCCTDKSINIWQKHKHNFTFKFCEHIKLFNENQNRILCFEQNLCLSVSQWGNINIMFIENNFELTEISKINLSSSNDDIYYGFPIYYNNLNNTIIIKHNDRIYFLKQEKDFNFNIYQCIRTGTSTSFGQVSKNGQYLIVWSKDWKKIKLFTLQQN